MFLSKSINFRAYLMDYEFFNEFLPNQTRKQLKTKLMVLYGKKKDRNHLKQKYQKAKTKWIDTNNIIKEAINQYLPLYI